LGTPAIEGFIAFSGFEQSYNKIANDVKIMSVKMITFMELGGNSQNFLRRIINIFVTLGLKILILLRLREVFKQISLNVYVN